MRTSGDSPPPFGEVGCEFWVPGGRVTHVAVRRLGEIADRPYLVCACGYEDHRVTPGKSGPGSHHRYCAATRKRLGKRWHGDGGLP